MSEEPSKPQETTTTVDEKVQAAKEAAMNVAGTAVDKADELYNKLPLDKINEQLKGKVDVKSSKFKRILGGSIAVLLILLLWFSCRGDNSKATFHLIKQEHFDYYSDSGLAFFKLLRPCYREWECTWECLFQLSEKGSIKFTTYTEYFEGKTASECMSYAHKNWGEKGEKVYNIWMDIAKPEEYKQKYEKELDKYVELNQHYHHIQKNFLSVFNQRLGELGSVYKVVSLETFFPVSESGDFNDEVWGGECKVLNTKTGAEVLEGFACLISWNKDGDDKYTYRSYDRPITLDWKMLHDIGDGNYLKDPRY